MADQQWGLYDTEDSLWMGDDEGPKVYDSFLIARVAAQMIDVQLGQRPGRTRAVEYQPGPKNLRDRVDTKMTTLEAVRRMESGIQ